MKRLLSRTMIVRVALAALVAFGSAFASISDSNVHAPPDYYTMQPPLDGGSYTDPVFGTSIKRITNARAAISADSGTTLPWIEQEYSTMSPFNPNNTLLLLIHVSYFALYDGSGHFLRDLPREVNASSQPRWSRRVPYIFYYIRGNELRQYNVFTSAISVVHTFSEYSSIDGKGESDISFDGDHFVFAGDNRYVFVYQISTDSKVSTFDTGGRGFDSLYITPNDNVTITWFQNGPNRYNGIELFDRNMNFQRQLTQAGGHMDVTRDTNGDEVLVWTNSNDPAFISENGIVKVRLADGHQTTLVTFDWSLAVHISAPDSSGWAFVETYAPGDPGPNSSGWKPYTNELLQIKLDGTEVRRLAHHRSRPFNSYNYEPKLSVSHDSTKLVYSSNFGLQGLLAYASEYSDVYLIDLGSSASGGGTTTGARVEQSDPAVVYSGSWFTNTNAVHSGGSAGGAMDSGSRASLTFTGTGVSWILYRDEWSGIANVYLDGVLKSAVDTYASPFLLRQGFRRAFSASSRVYGRFSGPKDGMV